VELTGDWRAAPADEELRRAYPAEEFDDNVWSPVRVPGHWRSTEAFRSSDGPLLHRLRFETPEPAAGRRSWLTFEGVFAQADVWLDGAYVGDAEGYFVPHAFEVTDALRAKANHTLAVEVTCAPDAGGRWNPGGIWRPVSLHETGPVAFRSVRVVCVEATHERAVVAVSAIVDAAEATDASFVSTIDLGTPRIETQHLAAGENRVAWRMPIEAPRLWWPRALGAAELVDIEIALLAGGNDDESDRREFRTGLRQVRMRDWILSINGERMFVKGSNQGPIAREIADASADDFARDVRLAQEAGLDLLRVHDHVSRRELYEAADRAGLLLWQDVPSGSSGSLGSTGARVSRKQAVKQARGAVDLLGHHPSVVVWCATEGVQRRAIEKADRSRPVVPHAGTLPATGGHLYLGWRRGHERDLPGWAKAWPRAVRFVGEFGAQAVPESDAFLDAARPDLEWPNLDWPDLDRDAGLDVAGFVRNGIDPASFGSYDAWKETTQAYQGNVVRHHVEALRRLKYRPTGGFAQFAFADAAPGVSFAVLDHDRVPKRAFAALAAACAPVIVVADRPRSSYVPGESLQLDVHVVSDLREPLDGLTVAARVVWTGGEATWRWSGDVPADACVRIGRIDTVVPDAPGRLTLELALDGSAGEQKAANWYESEIRSP
jgi:beta-mannosidase